MSSSRLRPATEGDAEQVAALFRATFPTWRWFVTTEDILSWLRDPEIGDRTRVLEIEGRVVGYGDVTAGQDMELDVVAPGHWDPFLDWLEERARESDLTYARVGFPEGHELQDVAAARGYTQWRSAHTMEIALAEPPEAVLPDGIDIRPYSDDVADTLRDGMNEAFAQDPFWHVVTAENFRTGYSGNQSSSPELWLLAWAGQELAGFVLPEPTRGSDKELGWVRVLGVRPRWRRQGLGEALLRQAFRELYDLGRRRVGLGVDGENPTGAVALYERVGMRRVSSIDNWRKAV
ncbi:MAG TPA: GNAT family N-acetyltransferase [Gaiellaceae bacterium]|jgi:mycothiol synthase